MPFEIKFENPPCGYAVSSVRAGEPHAEVQYLEFTSTEDGQYFIQRLEGFPSEILSKLPTPPSPSSIDHMLAIIRRDGRATVYVNELQLQMRTRVSKAIEAGSPVMKSDIVDVDRFDLGVAIEEDEGFLLVFSVGWRRGLFYDFGPLGLEPVQPRTFDIPSTLGQLYCHLFFQERFSISDEDWEKLYSSQWFPFAGLPYPSVEKLLSYIRSSWDPDELVSEFETAVKDRLQDWLQTWQRRNAFLPHIPFLECAAERFMAQDFISAVSILFSQIEGILRTYHRHLAARGFIRSRDFQHRISS